MELATFSDKDAWLQAMVDGWKNLGAEALQARGDFYAALSGGSTPAPFYQALAQSDWAWSSTRLFIGDERMVPAEDEQSNYRMIYRALYPHKVQLERWKTEHPKPEAAAKEYGQRVALQLGMPPRFDLVLLGIGDDGHTASLFPDTSALNESEAWAIENFVPKVKGHRLTFTYKLIDHAREVWFLAKGDSKKPWIEKMVAGEDKSFPAARITCEHGPVKIFFWEG